MAHPLAGTQAPPDLLIDVADLRRRYHEEVPDPAIPAPPATLRIFERTVDVTDQFAVEYNPNSVNR